MNHLKVVTIGGLEVAPNPSNLPIIPPGVKGSEEKPGNLVSISIPYFKGVAEKLRRIERKYNIRMANFLVKNKPHGDQNKNVVMVSPVNLEDYTSGRQKLPQDQDESGQD